MPCSLGDLGPRPRIEPEATCLQEMEAQSSKDHQDIAMLLPVLKTAPPCLGPTLASSCSPEQARRRCLWLAEWGRRGGENANPGTPHSPGRHLLHHPASSSSRKAFYPLPEMRKGFPGGSDGKEPAYNTCVSSRSVMSLCNPMDCSPPSSPVHGISQARILEWAAISSRGSSRPRD